MANFKAKKSLGQNFLKSKEALRLIVSAGNISESDTVIEVGPGRGVLTEMLLPLAKKVIAIEKDHRLIPILADKFSQEIKSGKLEILEKDILEYEPEFTEPYKIVANIPYYITGALLKKFLSMTNQPERMVLLLQKEVAERIVVRDGKESILSISVKAYGDPKYIKTVKAKYFSPEPNVDSAIILIENISRDTFQNISEGSFFELVKSGFAHKRKRLMSNISKLFPEKNLEEVFSKLAINKNARPENLAVRDWVVLSEIMARQ